MGSKNSKNKTALIIGLILVLLLGGIGYYLIQKFNSDKKQEVEQDSALLKKEYQLDTGVLKSEFFKNLTRYGDYPIEPRFPGRENPFTPY